MPNWDVIVLGLGVMGLSACREIARRGKRVLGLEQYELFHKKGSSHGETRIIRKAYFEHIAYVPLLERAYRAWAEIQETLGVPLFERTGVLIAGMPGSAIVRGVRQAAVTHGVEIDELSAASVARRFPGLAVDDDMQTVFEPDAGFLRAEACMRGLAELAQREGAVLFDRRTVTDFSGGARQRQSLVERRSLRGADADRDGGRLVEQAASRPGGFARAAPQTAALDHHPQS